MALEFSQKQLCHTLIMILTPCGLTASGGLRLERLYTNIDTDDMQHQIMDLVTQVFGLPQHAAHVGIKVWHTQPAVWLKANRMPAHDHDRSGSGHGGEFMIFDLETVEMWLTFLLTHMYVRFGDKPGAKFRGPRWAQIAPQTWPTCT